jgi:hypothetical protein
MTDANFVSRFPLVEVKAKNAAEAARIIARHLDEARAQGWRIGPGWALVDQWRNEYDLVKGTERTVMRFDMRPSLFNDSKTNLTTFSLMAGPMGSAELEDLIRRFEASKQRPREATSTSIQVNYRKVARGIAIYAAIAGVIAAVAGYWLELVHSLGGALVIGSQGALAGALFGYCQFRIAYNEKLSGKP